MSRDVGTIMFDIVFEMDNSFRWVMEFKISGIFMCVTLTRFQYWFMKEKSFIETVAQNL